MQGPAITEDFVMSQLRLALVALFAYGGGKGWFTPADTTFYLALMTSLGPLLAPWIWSIFSNLGTVRISSNSAAAVVAQVEKTDQTAATVGASAATAAVVKVLLIAFALSAFLAVPSAMAQVKLKPLTGNLGNDLGITKPAPASAVGLIPTIDPQVLIQKVLALAAPDLVYAVALAKSANTTSSNVRLQCLTAIQNLNAQASGANLKDAAGNPLPSPAEPHIFTDLEQVAEGIDALSPTGPLFTSCAGAAALAGMNVLAFINAAVAGTAATAIVLPK